MKPISDYGAKEQNPRRILDPGFRRNDGPRLYRGMKSNHKYVLINPSRSAASSGPTMTFQPGRLSSSSPLMDAT